MRDLDHSHDAEAGHEGGHGEARRIVILGFFRAASALLSEIERQNPSLLEQISVVDFNPKVFRTLADRGLHVIYGDISNVDTLVHAGVGKAELIILSVPDSLLKGANNEKLVRHVRSLNPTAKIVATADMLADVDDLYAAGADYVTVTRLSDAHELYTVIEAAEAGTAGRQARRDGRAAQRAQRSAAVARCAGPRAVRWRISRLRGYQETLWRRRVLDKPLSAKARPPGNHQTSGDGRSRLMV